MSEEPKPAESGGPAAGSEWPRLNGSSHEAPGGSLAGAKQREAAAEELPAEEATEGLSAAPRRNEDPLIPEVYRETIPPPPRGWTEDRWRQSFLGNERPAARGQGLTIGRGWLLALVFAIVALVLVIFIALAH